MSSSSEAPRRDLSALKHQAERAYARALAKGYKREAEMFRHAAEALIVHDNSRWFEAIGLLNKVPVTIDEFVQSKEFMGELMEVWPTLMPDLRAMNPDVMLGEDPVFEALLGGATGTGKTHLSQLTQSYQLYLFSCFRSPQKLFRLAPNTPIVFMFQSVSSTITRRVIFSPFRVNFLAMPYTKKWIEYDKYTESSLKLNNGVMVVPGLASLQALVGQAIPSAILDEVNFMAVIEQSAQVPGPDGKGGKYDQAEMVYRNISRRRKRSFLTNGPSLGCLCVVSSTRYKNDFLDRRIDEVHRFEEKNILTLRRKQYEVAPPGRYAGPTFPVLIGTDTYPTRVLEEEEATAGRLPETAHIERVPVELRVDFLRDPEAAQRDYCGIATNAISPFIARRDKIVAAILRGREQKLPMWVEKHNTVLSAGEGLPQVREDLLPADKDTPRWAHVDLSTASDRCGIAIVSCAGHAAQAVEEGVVHHRPVWKVELAVSIEPSSIHQLDIGDVRNWLVQLVAFWGINIVQVSYDGFQSKESQQTLRKSGVMSREVSVDRSPEAYKVLRTALYEDRVVMYDNELLLLELGQLEELRAKNKIDHPAKGSKDVSDAVAGAIYAASQSALNRNRSVVTDDTGRRVTNIQTERRRQGVSRAPGTRRQ